MNWTQISRNAPVVLCSRCLTHSLSLSLSLSPLSLSLSLSLSSQLALFAAACDSDPVVRVDDANSSSVVLTPISEVSSADLSVSSPHFQNPDGLLEPTGSPSETAAQQDNPTEDTPAEKDPKNSNNICIAPSAKSQSTPPIRWMLTIVVHIFLSLFIYLFTLPFKGLRSVKNFVKEMNQKCQ